MGKYALLLHGIAKHSEVQFRSQLREAEALVKFQLRHGNDLLSMDSIVNCDVNLKEQGELLRQVRFHNLLYLFSCLWNVSAGKTYYD